MLEPWQEATEGPRFLERELPRILPPLLREGGCGCRPDAEPSPALVTETARWYAERWEQFAHCESAHGWDWWTLDHTAVCHWLWWASHDAGRVLEARQEEERRQAEARRYPTVTAWLHALHRGQLKSVGPSEPHAVHVINRNGRRGSFRRYWEVRVRADAARRRICASCGVEFSGAHRRVKRCPACRGKAPRPTPPEVTP